MAPQAEVPPEREAPSVSGAPPVREARRIGRTTDATPATLRSSSCSPLPKGADVEAQR